VKLVRPQPYGILAGYAEPEPMVAAARKLRSLGFTELDAFTPFPVEEMDDVLQTRSSTLPWIVLAGAIVGAVAAYALILYSVEIDYPINVGGRPLNAWPAYAVLAFEGGILGASLAGFAGMLALNRLPTYYHPVFNAPSFTFARDDRFFLLVRCIDPAFNRAEIGDRLKASGAILIEDVAQ
jgi:hypothetical protein